MQRWWKFISATQKMVWNLHAHLQLVQSPEAASQRYNCISISRGSKRSFCCSIAYTIQIHMWRNLGQHRCLSTLLSQICDIEKSLVFQQPWASAEKLTKIRSINSNRRQNYKGNSNFEVLPNHCHRSLGIRIVNIVKINTYLNSVFIRYQGPTFHISKRFGSDLITWNWLLSVTTINNCGLE